ncbi:hypothetical protein, partial [Sphaerisporangium sp. NPDC051011]|uniref:hypothetical protein n=1 Tax=Sphaerisporangium sp. NPDC051011 TaxID=3155792 RepID=UPI0033FBE813
RQPAMRDGGSCMIHALAFNTLLSSQETDAYTAETVIQVIAAPSGAFVFIFYFTRPERFGQIN